MSEEWAEKVAADYESGEIIEYPDGDPRGIYGFEGTDKKFGYKDGRGAVRQTN